MHNLALLDESFKKFIKNFKKWPSESVIQVDLHLLHEMDLLHFHHKSTLDPNLTRYFQVVESPEKITLINDDFVVWITPEKISRIPQTYTIIAINHPEDLQMELAFITSGVYNTSFLVLRLLEKFLFEIQETEDLLSKIKKF